VLLNNSDGTFANQVTYTTGSLPFSVFSSDLDGDGDLDLATANSGSDNISVLPNNGDGTFAAQETYAAGTAPHSVFASDLDSDGDLDLATANSGSDNISVLFKRYPNFELNPMAFNYCLNAGDANPADQVLAVESEYGTIDFAVSDDADWLTVAPDSGTTPDFLMLSVDITGLPLGVHQGVIALSSEQADNSPQRVEVRLIILHPDVLLGDLNLNGYAYEVGDFVLAYTAFLDIFGYPLSERQRWAGDIDQDGRPISITDLLSMCYYFFGESLPNYPRNPRTDTLKIESTVAMPGDQLSLPIYLITTDTLVDFQAYLVSETNYIILDSVILNEELWLGQTNVSGFPHIFSSIEDECFYQNPELFCPGTYLLGNLIGRVKPDIYQVISIPIEFHNEVQYLAYTGLINSTFFEPIVINANITILGEGGLAYLPGDVNMPGGTWPPAATGPDVTYLVNFFRGLPTSQSCLLDGFWCSADANGDCNIIGNDVTRLVNYFRGQANLLFCPDYPPLWPTPAYLPAEAPVGWPDCETVTRGMGTFPGESNK